MNRSLKERALRFSKSCGAFALAVAAILAPARGEPAADAAAIELLREGGFLLVMRHANSPIGQPVSIGMTKGCLLEDGRGLDAKGFYQARYIGEWLTANGVPLAKGYTSDMCRSWDTARLVAGPAPVEPAAELKTTDLTLIAPFKERLMNELEADPGANILLVTHSNIAPLYGAAAQAGEEEVPSGRLYAIRPGQCEEAACPAILIDLIVEIGALGSNGANGR